MLQHLEAKDNDIVEVNTKVSTADAHLQQKQLSPAAPPLVHSTANANGNASGSSNTDFISTKMNLLNSPDVRTLHPMPFAGGDSLQLEDKNTTHTQQPAGSAAASALSPAYRDCFNCRRKLYIQPRQSTTFTDIPHVNNEVQQRIEHANKVFGQSLHPRCHLLFVSSSASLNMQSFFGVHRSSKLTKDFQTHTSSAAEIENKLLTDKRKFLHFPALYFFKLCYCSAVFFSLHCTITNTTAGSSNTDFIPTKMNLLNSPDVRTLHPMASAGGSAQMNTNVSNIENKRQHSEQAGVPCTNVQMSLNFFDFLTHTSSTGEIKNKLLTDKHTAIWLPIFPTTMVLRLNIDQIEPATRDWICKVQIVEIGRPRESLDKKYTFQNLILEDEQLMSTFYNSYFHECQIRAVMYTDEIEQYAATLKLFNTYLISTARVKPLPPPTKLNITSFDRIPHLMVDSAAEIDVLAVVLRYGPQKNAGRSHHRFQEITLCDNQQNQFLFTL
ncbi:hypothetical protein MTR67_022386 [Solanum verrucosum]|uniref:Uncharacterized protein n=1 Tax=Solanum verrucosum TaxID=315347 RepID=A0AAF0TQQ4_SOLVR|nr:hypothetical protein MTR67_022386 [Solanum verrucosum]